MSSSSRCRGCQAARATEHAIELITSAIAGTKRYGIGYMVWDRMNTYAGMTAQAANVETPAPTIPKRGINAILSAMFTPLARMRAMATGRVFFTMLGPMLAM